MTSSVPTVVSLGGVTKKYSDAGGRRNVLDSLSLDLLAGDFLSITGPSGSGKSTLLNILGGVDLPDSGDVRICDQDMVNKNETDRTLFRRHHIGFVFQFFNLVPTLTVRENLQLPLLLCGKDADGAVIDRWLSRFNLTDRGLSYPEVLSGGEQQRVAVIRAAIHQPAVILADEPTGNLDRESGELVLSLLRDVVETGTCVVMATHSDVAAAAANKSLQLRDGRLASTPT